MSRNHLYGITAGNIEFIEQILNATVKLTRHFISYTIIYVGETLYLTDIIKVIRVGETERTGKWAKRLRANRLGANRKVSKTIRERKG